MSYQLRPHTDADLPAMLACIRAAFAQYQGLLDPPSSAEQKTLEHVRAELRDAEALVAEQDGSLVGCVFLHRRAESVYIDRLSVLPSHRGHGIGDALLRAVEKRARGQGARGLSLSVRLALEAQQDYYRRRGFAHASFGTHAGYTQPTYRNMFKPLTLALTQYEDEL